MAELIGSITILIGAVFLFSAGLGMLRMPDAFTRIRRAQGLHARQHAGAGGDRLLPSRLEPEAADHRLLRADDQSDLFARARPRREYNSAPGAIACGRCVARGPETERRVMRREAAIVLIAFLGVIFATIAASYSQRSSLPELAAAYVDLVPRELGAPNVITGILLTYRAFDTLGEVAVLFMVAAGVGLLLGAGGEDRDEVQAGIRRSLKETPPTEIVQNGADILVPLIAIFAAYIVMHGHLGPGGGFQGGAVMASCVLLLLLAKPDYRIKLAHFSFIELLAGLLIVVVGIAGIILASGFLDNRVLPLGEFGALFSAGAIPVLSVLLGVKVGCELSVIIERFRA